MGRAVFASSLFAAVAVLGVACTSVSEPPGSGAAPAGQATEALAAAKPRLILPLLKDRRSTAADDPRAGGVVQYTGGYVLPSVHIYAIYWGSQVNPAWAPIIPGFFQKYFPSAAYTWLSEYDTVGTINGHVGTNQHITPGTFESAITITPANAGNSLKEADILTELNQQMNAGTIPKPIQDASGNANTTYFVFMPPTLTVEAGAEAGNGVSCQQWCGYHSAATLGGKNTTFAMIADCTSGCGAVTVDVAHELVEAVTDPSIFGQISWYDPNNGQETGDLCASISSSYLGYSLQPMYSNVQVGCVTTYPICSSSVTANCRTCVAADDNTICNGMTPYCATTAGDPLLGKCVACRVSSECTGTTPVCNNAGGDVCTGCSKNADCTSPFLCETAGMNKGACVQCTQGNPGACTGAKPKCDLANDTCVQCLSNADCSGATPICDPTSNSCVNCVSNMDCTKASPVCNGNKCGPCTTNGECTGGGICDTSNDADKGQCVQCDADSDCTAPAKCNTTSHTCGACTPTEGCSDPKPVCDMGSTTCRGCMADGECTGNPKGSACETAGANAGSCVACSATNASACTGATAACNANNGTCVACNTTADCKDPMKVCSGAHTCDPCGGDAGACPGGPPPGGGGGGCATSPGDAGAKGAGVALLFGLALLGARRRRAG